MSEKDVSKGLSIVIFFYCGVISIGSLYMAIESCIKQTYDPLYLTITGINIAILLVLGGSYLIEKCTSNVELSDNNVSDNFTSVV